MRRAGSAEAALLDSVTPDDCKVQFKIKWKVRLPGRPGSAQSARRFSCRAVQKLYLEANTWALGGQLPFAAPAPFQAV